MKTAIQFLCVLAIAGLGSAAKADTRIWDNDTGSGEFFVGYNWQPDGGPNKWDNLTVDFGDVTADYDCWIEDGGKLTVCGAGTSIMMGPNLYVGDQTEGTCRIESGAAVETTYRVWLGNESGAQGTMTVTGAGSSLKTKDYIWVGYHGNGKMVVEDGASVTSTGATFALGTLGYGEAEIRGEGTKVNLPTGDMRVGFSGDGKLTVEQGANVTCSNLSMSYYYGSDSSAIVDGVGTSISCANDVRLGENPGSRGVLTIRNGAVVTGNCAIVGGTGAARGVLTVNGLGSRLSLRDSIYAGSHSELHVLDQGLVSIPDGYYLENEGLVTGDSRIDGNVVNESGGRIAPGSSVGRLSIDGTCDLQSGGRLEIELGGLATGQYDTLATGGWVNMDGLLDVELVNDYVPSPGNTFEIVTAMSVQGQFAGMSLPTLPEGRWWEIDYGAESVTLAVVPEPATLSLLALGGLAVVRRRRRK